MSTTEERRQYRLNNKDKVRIWKRRDYLKNKEKYNLYTKEYNLKNKEKYKENRTINYKENRDLILKKNKEYRQKNKDKIKLKSAHRNKLIKYRKYGITEQQYNEMFKNQNGLCAICHNPEITMKLNKIIPLAIDHCHKSGKVRGLLCRQCNVGIGFLKDDINLLKNATNYLTASLEGINEAGSSSVLS